MNVWEALGSHIPDPDPGHCAVIFRVPSKFLINFFGMKIDATDKYHYAIIQNKYVDLFAVLNLVFAEEVNGTRQCRRVTRSDRYVSERLIELWLQTKFYTST